MPEVRRLVLAMAQSGENKTFSLRWSVWRRAHQALAARCRTSRRAPDEETSPSNTAVPQVAVITPRGDKLTDTQWELIRHLLPPQRPPIGRPRHDHRAVLSGMLWVTRTHSSWREMPEEFGKWETAYRRYRLWLDQGLWQRIVEALRIEGCNGEI